MSVNHSMPWSTFRRKWAKPRNVSGGELHFSGPIELLHQNLVPSICALLVSLHFLGRLFSAADVISLA